MILFTPCKINLGLKLLNKREDGYHNLETCMYQLPFYDILEVNKSTDFQFTTSGLKIPGELNNNSCVKAFELLNKQFSIDPIKIHLHKILPMGGGIGGGSANATYVLKAIQQLYGLPITQEQLKDFAAELGSDCPTFVKEVPQIATGRGEILTTIDFSLKGYYLKLINLGIHISTRDAFSHVECSADTTPISTILRLPIENWRTQLTNDFEKTVFNLHPSLETIKNKMYEEGAVYASMTGSGSTMYGIYAKKPSNTLEVKPNQFEKIIAL